MKQFSDELPDPDNDMITSLAINALHAMRVEVASRISDSMVSLHKYSLTSLFNAVTELYTCNAHRQLSIWWQWPL